MSALQQHLTRQSSQVKAEGLEALEAQLRPSPHPQRPSPFLFQNSAASGNAPSPTHSNLLSLKAEDASDTGKRVLAGEDHPQTSASVPASTPQVVIVQPLEDEHSGSRLVLSSNGHVNSANPGPGPVSLNGPTSLNPSSKLGSSVLLGQRLSGNKSPTIRPGLHKRSNSKISVLSLERSGSTQRVSMTPVAIED